MHGHEVMLPLDLIIPKPRQEYKEDDRQMENPDTNAIIKRFQDIYRQVRQAQEDAV